MAKQEVSTKSAPEAIGPYSQAIKSGDTVYCSGQIPLDPVSGKLVEGDISLETKQVMDNLFSVLNEAGASSENVVKTTIFLTDMSDFSAVNEIYSKYFDTPYPARATVQVSNLPLNVRVEIDAIAKV